MILLPDGTGGCSPPVLLPGQPARERLPSGRGEHKVVERPERSAAETAAARGDQQNPSPPSVASHQGAHRGE